MYNRSGNTVHNVLVRDETYRAYTSLELRDGS